MATQPLYGSVANRTDSLAGFFGIVAVYLFLRFRRRPSGPTYAFLVLAVALALLTKETAVAVPLVFVLHDLVFPELRGRHAYRTHIPLISLMVVYLGVRVILLGSVGSLEEGEHLGSFDAFITNARAALTILFTPALPPFGIRQRWLMLGLALILFSAVQVIRRRPVDLRAMSFLGIGYLVLAAPVLFVLPGIGSGRFAYLSGASLLILLAYLTVESFRAATAIQAVSLRAAVAVPLATLCLASAGFGLRSFRDAYERGTAASRMAESLLRQVGQVLPHQNGSDRLYFTAVPAVLSGSAVFYNGLCDAIHLRYPRLGECYVLCETILKRASDAKEVTVRLSPGPILELSTPPDGPTSFILPQADIERLREGESLKSKFHTVTALGRGQPARGGGRVVAVKIQLHPHSITRPGRNHLLHFDGERLHLLTAPVPDC